MIGRRAVLALIALAAVAPQSARAQQPVPVIGWLSGRTPEAEIVELASFRRGLREAGFVEGRDVAIDTATANGDRTRLPDLAADLVRRRVNLIVAVGGGDAVPAARAAAPTLPIVATFAQDPVQMGYVASLARPGGNITGVSFLGSETQAKSLELLRELVPSVTSVAALINSDLVDAQALQALRTVVEATAASLDVRIEFFAFGRNDSFDQVFARVVERRHGALLVNGSFGLMPPAERARIVDLAARHRLPATYIGLGFKEFGALMTYGNDRGSDAYHRLGLVAARVLRGAPPAALPVEQPTRFVMTVNLKTARALGITVPPSILARADEVIE